ncbi:YceI family protein [Pontimicrobium sp. SW4]|uniref:YceI family protein n=1 Tax=Pontimicrobium sp. SW4 TaxID=3153519 RepID=A0AAU7BUY3_9FLAO
MKNNILKSTLILVLAITLASFTSLSEKNVDVTKSNITWKAYKVTGSHSGIVSLKSGSLNFDNDKLTGGTFIVDMTSIKTTDMQGKSATNLDNHLKSDDFFSVESHPLANINFKAVKSSGKNSYTVNADLTIKGKTNPVSFEMSIYGNKATASLKVDRTKYGIEYKSNSFFDNLKDKAIYDEFDLIVDLQF